uniref:Uncharacterized protein n=1 Tax=Panagrolaimus superbus TaxID=310955 RepID=A0A914YEJ2_9BILA
MRIQHPVHAQQIAGGETDAADLLTTGIDAAVYLQAAAIDADINVACLHFIADHQVAFAQLERPATGNATGGKPGVQAGEVLQLACTHYQLAAVVGHFSATGVVAAAGSAKQRACQIHTAALRAQRSDRQAAAAVVAGGKIDARRRVGNDVTVTARQRYVAAPTVLVHVEQADLPPRHVQHCIAAKRHALAGIGFRTGRTPTPPGCRSQRVRP